MANYSRLIDDNIDIANTYLSKNKIVSINEIVDIYIKIFEVGNIAKYLFYDILGGELVEHKKELSFPTKLYGKNGNYLYIPTNHLRFSGMDSNNNYLMTIEENSFDYENMKDIDENNIYTYKIALYSTYFDNGLLIIMHQNSKIKSIITNDEGLCFGCYEYYKNYLDNSNNNKFAYNKLVTNKNSIGRELNNYVLNDISVMILDFIFEFYLLKLCMQ
jgi:hypothetical protein